MRAALWLSMAFASVAALPQELTPPPNAVPAEPPRVLSSAGRVSFGIPLFGFNGNSVCDASGNEFFNVSSWIDQKGPFLEVSADGRRHAVYTLPAEVGPRENLVWTVTPDGAFFVLHQNFKDYRLIRFKDDGSPDGITSLAIPPGAHVQHMSIADNGTMYVRGYRSTKQPTEKARPGFAALIDASGKLLRDLSSDAPEADLKAAGQHPLDGDATAGADGRFYILESERVLVLNQAGEVERILKIKKPNPDAIASRVDYSKGMVSIMLHTGHPKHGEATEVESRALLLNAQTGEQQGDFVFDPATTGAVTCFNAQDGYSLTAMDGNMAAKDIVPIR